MTRPPCRYGTCEVGCHHDPDMPRLCDDMAIPWEAWVAAGLVAIPVIAAVAGILTGGK